MARVERYEKFWECLPTGAPSVQDDENEGFLHRICLKQRNGLVLKLDPPSPSEMMARERLADFLLGGPSRTFVDGWVERTPVHWVRLEGGEG